MPHPVERAGRKNVGWTATLARGLQLQRVNEAQPGHEVGLRSSFIEKAVSTPAYEFGDSGNCRRQHDLGSSHRLHQNQRNPLTAAGQHHDVRALIQRVHLVARYMPQQGHVFLQAVFADQRLQPSPFRSVARNLTFEADARRPQLRARADQKGVIFHAVQAPHGYQSEPVARSSAADLESSVDLYSEPRHQHLLFLNSGVMVKNESPVVFRHSQTEVGVLKFHVEISCMLQQIRAMKRHAETHVQQARRRQGNPGPEITVMCVDVLDAGSRQAHRVTSPQPRVQQSFDSLYGILAPAKDDSPQQWRNAFPAPQAER